MSVSQLPPAPRSERPIGRTQHDAEIRAIAAAVPTVAEIGGAVVCFVRPASIESIANLMHPVVATGARLKMTQYTIGEASRRSGVVIETIRYYEREGVVPAAARTNSGRRVYSSRDVAQLRFVKRCRELGFPIRDVRALLGLALDDAPHCAEARDIAESNLGLIRAKIADLRSLEKAIVAQIEHCADGQGACPMLDDLLSDK